MEPEDTVGPEGSRDPAASETFQYGSFAVGAASQTFALQIQASSVVARVLLARCCFS